MAHKYLYEGKHAGQARTGHVEAESVAEARRRLAADGLTEIVIHDDDFLASLRAADEKQVGGARLPDIEAMLRHDPSAWTMTRYMLRKNWIALFVIAAGLCWFAATETSPWTWIVFITFSGLLAQALAFPGWLQWQQNEMYRRFWAADWNGSEAIARRLRNLKVTKKLPAAMLEFDARIGAALVMKGKAAEAYALIEPWRGNPTLAKGVFQAKENSLHFLARDWKRAVEGAGRFLEDTGNSESGRIDLAQTLARLGDDDARAWAALESVDRKSLISMQVAFAAWAEGVLLLRRGDDERALQALVTGVTEMQKLAVNPMAWGALASTVGYLCVAMARTGRLEEARVMFASARTLVERHGEDRLIGWLRDAKVTG